MRLNPIVKRDVKVQSRSMKICWGVFAYELILALVFFLAMLIIRQVIRYSDNVNLYGALVWLYPVLAITQLVILIVVVPVRTASSISGERERQTFDLMMTTGMTPFSIITGKVTTAIVQSMFFVVASMPIMALPFVIGGMSWSWLFWFLAVAFLMSFFAASIGIFCSSVCRRSIGAVFMSYGFYLVFFLATMVPYIVYQITLTNMRNTPTYLYGENLALFLLLNPIVYLVEFFGRVMTGESLVNTFFNDLTYATQTHGPIRYVLTGPWWIILSTVLLIGVSFLFLALAARRINPIKGRAKKLAARQEPK